MLKQYSKTPRQDLSTTLLHCVQPCTSPTATSLYCPCHDPSHTLLLLKMSDLFRLVPSNVMIPFFIWRELHILVEWKNESLDWEANILSNRQNETSAFNSLLNIQVLSLIFTTIQRSGTGLWHLTQSLIMICVGKWVNNHTRNWSKTLAWKDRILYFVHLNYLCYSNKPYVASPYASNC